MQGSINLPTVSKSDLPGLLGLATLKKRRTIIDTVTGKLYMMGPGDYDLLKAMPPGTDVFQCEYAPSGHMILPCAEHAKGEPRKDEEDFVLYNRDGGNRQVETIAPPPPQPAPAVVSHAALPPVPSANVL